MSDPTTRTRPGPALWALIGLLILQAHPALGAPQGVRLIGASASKVRLTVEVPVVSLEPAEGASTTTAGLQVKVDGYDLHGASGEPPLPERIVLVAVPPTGTVTLRATGRDAVWSESVNLAPVPVIARGAEDRPPVFTPRADVYGDPASRAPEPATLLDVSWMRNQRVARILLQPVDYQPARRRMRAFRHIDVEVSVEGAARATRAREPVDPFENVYSKLVVNYEQGKQWRRSAADGLREGSASLIPAAVQGSPGSVFAGRTWIKIAIEQTGFYKVEFGQLRNFPLFSGDTTTVLDSLRLFGWPGYPVLSEDDYCDGCDYEEVAIGLIDNGDGRFNRNSDAFYFFALGPNDWANLYDPARPDTDYVNHPYETRSYYYLTVSNTDPPGAVPGPFQRIAQQSGAVSVDGGEITPTSFAAREHRELDVEYLPDLFPGSSTLFWEKWFWQVIAQGASFRSSFDLPGLDVSVPGRLRARLWGTEGTGSHFADIILNDTNLGRVSWNDVDPGPPARARHWAYTFDGTVANLAESANEVEVLVPQIFAGRVDKIAVAWYDAFYARRLDPVQDELDFDSPDSSGNFIHQVGPFEGIVPPRVFDTTLPFRPIELFGFEYVPSDTIFTLRFETNQTGRRSYRAIQASSIELVSSSKVSSARSTSLVDLRSSARRADYLVIYFDEFKAAADSMAAWRRHFKGFEVETVPISALYDQFSGGRTDPAAIRNFLRAAFLLWDKAPAYVAFLGDASHDFKNLKGRAAPGHPGTLLPSYEGGYDIFVRRQFATDDWLLNVDDTQSIIPDFFGGRLPAEDAAIALSMVRNKVLRYERSTPFGEYRNRIMLIADDNFQAERPDGLGWIHLGQTADVDTLDTPQHMDRAYVYLHTYPTRSGSKPDARNDIHDIISNQGVAMFNFIGHGSPFKISDESVFLDSDVGTLTNADRLPVFVAASCDIGKFNDPGVLSLGERLLIHEGGGAVGVISATELAFSNQNFQLNRDLYQFIFSRNAEGKYHVGLSEALLMGKTGRTNAQKYQLMGDPAVRLNLPELWSDVTLWDSTGTVQRLNLERGSTVLMRGRVLSGPGGTPVVLEGVAALRIEDSQPPARVPDCNFRPDCSCIQPGDPQSFDRYNEPCFYGEPGPIYLGDVEVRNGEFEGRFIVPLEANMGDRARVRAYFSGGISGTTEQRDGVGSIFTNIVQGSGSSNDQSGPRIALAFAGGATFVRPNATLVVDLFDESGILITGHTPQNGIVVTVDENSTLRTDITPSFRYAAGSYQAGTASFQLDNLAPGSHRIRVSAADNLAAGLQAGAHRSSAVIDFEVLDVPPLKITSAFLFPNPTRSGGPRSGGQFVVDAPGDSVNMMVRIYTVSGRLVRVLKAFGGIGQVQMAWDGLDSDGEKLANGVYLFKVHANVRDPEGLSSPRQEAVSEGRIVIVN